VSSARGLHINLNTTMNSTIQQDIKNRTREGAVIYKCKFEYDHQFKKKKKSLTSWILQLFEDESQNKYPFYNLEAVINSNWIYRTHIHCPSSAGKLLFYCCYVLMLMTDYSVKILYLFHFWLKVWFLFWTGILSSWKGGLVFELYINYHINSSGYDKLPQ